MPCVRVILVLVWKTLILFLVWGTYYVSATHVPGISRLPKKSLRACARAVCSSNLGFSVENTNHGLVWGTYYVPATYVPGISRLIDT